MQHAHRLLLPAKETFEVHEARHVISGEDFGAGLFVIGDAVVAHHAGDGFLGDGERAAETATFVGAFQGRELNAVEFVEQRLRFVGGGPTSSLAEPRRSSRRPWQL